MGNGIIAFFVAGGAFMWVYSKTNRSTGGNLKNTLVVAGTAAVVVFLIALAILGMIPSASE